jgi:antitoxin ParD1/3/4
MLNGLRQTAVVKPGGLIEVQSADLPVGSTVEVIVLINSNEALADTSHPLGGLTQEERIAKIRSAVGGWKEDPEIADIFAVIDQERHAYQGRAIAPLDHE